MWSHHNPLFSLLMCSCLVYMRTMVLYVKSWQESWQPLLFSPCLWLGVLENNGVMCEVMATPFLSAFMCPCLVYLRIMMIYVKSWQQSQQPSLFSPCLWLGVLIREQWCYMWSHGNPILISIHVSLFGIPENNDDICEVMTTVTATIIVLTMPVTWCIN